MLKLKYMILVQLVIVGFILATTKADEEISHYGNYIVILYNCSMSENNKDYFNFDLKSGVGRRRWRQLERGGWQLLESLLQESAASHGQTSSPVWQWWEQSRAGASIQWALQTRSDAHGPSVAENGSRFAENGPRSASYGLKTPTPHMRSIFKTQTQKKTSIS